MARGRIEVERDKLEWALAQTNSASAAANELGLSYATFKRRCEELGIFKTNMSGKGTKRPAPWLVVPLEDILTNKYFMTGQGLKRKLIKAGLIEDRCVGCGLGPWWNAKPLTLQLDHINGDRANNSLSNLRVLCPSCHSQTDTFSKGKFRQCARGEMADTIA